MNEENKNTNNKTPVNAPEKESVFKKPWVHSLASFIVIFGLLGLFLFWQEESSSVFIENSNLEAPIINLAPSSGGVLNALYVKEGQAVPADAQVALVGSQIISAQDGGIVSSAPEVLGSYFSPGQTVVSVVNDQQMKVVGQIDETKGLDKIKTFHDFDNQYTGPMHGFKDAHDYYTKSSSVFYLDNISIPTLIINAKNDPFLPKECFPIDIAQKHKYLFLEMPDSGGHVGFFDGHINGHYWSERRALEFFLS